MVTSRFCGVRLAASANFTMSTPFSITHKPRERIVLNKRLSDTLTAATNALSRVNASITNLNKQLATLGSGARALTKHRDFLAQLSDALETGIGNLVDADLAKESAKLQSLQVKQQLGAQALSIANQTPQILLSFFSNG